MLDVLNKQSGSDHRCFDDDPDRYDDGIRLVERILAQENRLLRMAGKEPEVIAYLTTTPIM